VNPETPLSPREWTVLSLVAAGMSNRAISQALTISVNTLETHLRRIYQKLDLENRSQATRWYILNEHLRRFEAKVADLEEELGA
jgi:ATP/maltotriose-dependent transcriptional regulator MalT